MIKGIFFLFALFGALFFVIDDVKAVPTYIGIEIMNLTDDPANSCIGETGYPSTGRVRALSSILPSYPLFINLTRLSDGNEIWSGDISKNCSSYNNGCDYTIGDVIFIPDSVDLTSGLSYNLFMDIDAIRIFLPLVNYASFVATGDNNYWTVGGFSSTNPKCEYGYMSGSGVCDSAIGEDCVSGAENNLLIGNTRNANMIPGSCFSDLSVRNCPSSSSISIHSTGNFDFNINQQYHNLHQTGVGNINLAFQFS